MNMSETIEKKLKESLKGKVLILGIGNPLRTDDGFGSLLADRLKDRVAATVIDAKSVPENYINKLIDENPDTIVILDAADFEGEPAEVRIFDPHEATSINHISTHNLPINMLVEFIGQNCEAEVLFLALQPKSVSFGEDISKETGEKIAFLEDVFLRLLPKTAKQTN